MKTFLGIKTQISGLGPDLWGYSELYSQDLIPTCDNDFVFDKLVIAGCFSTDIFLSNVLLFTSQKHVIKLEKLGYM